MFKLKKLDCKILNKMDRELLLIEIKGISEAKKHLDKITLVIFSIIYGFVTFIFSHFESYTKENLLIISILSGIYFLVGIAYNSYITKQLKEYEIELYELAIEKGNRQ